MTWFGAAVAAMLFVMCCVGYKRGLIKEIVSAFFIVLAMLVVWLINPYVNTFITENTPAYKYVQNACEEFIDDQVLEITTFGKAEQERVIMELKLPEFLKKRIEENNNAQVYQYLAVNTFTEYVSGYLARAVVNGIAFLLSYILATLAIRILTYALNILANLPVLRGINKAAGALIGISKGIIFVWIAFIVITVLYNTSFGNAMLQMVEQDKFLKSLYDTNILMRIFMDVFNGTM